MIRVILSTVFPAAVAALIAGSIATAVAQRASEGSRDVAVGDTFTYQGRLETGGVAQTGSYDFQFLLFDTGGIGTGVQQGITVDAPAVDVANGLFTIRLSFPGQFSGSARFIETRVRPAGGGSYAIVGRQELTATPYALYAKSIPLAGSGTATTAARSDHDHFGQDWIGGDPNVPGLSVRNTDTQGTGLYVEGGPKGIWVLSSDPSGFGLDVQAEGSGVRSQASGSYAVWGISSMAGAQGVRGEAPQGNGVVGVTAAKGWAATSGVSTGANCNSGGFETLTDNCIGLYGTALGGSLGMGVVGLGSTTGVFGKAEGTFATGVLGVSSNEEGVGVKGLNRHTNCSPFGFPTFPADGCVGVVGATVSPGGVGVSGVGGKIGVAGAPTGNVVGGVGIYGYTQGANQFAGYFNGGTTQINGTFVNSSDARLKHDIAALDNGLEQILALRPVSFAWNTDEAGAAHHYGFIAQEVQQVIPDLVITGADGEHLAMDSLGLIAVLAKAVQTQQEEIDDLRALIAGK